MSEALAIRACEPPSMHTSSGIEPCGLVDGSSGPALAEPCGRRVDPRPDAVRTRGPKDARVRNTRADELAADAGTARGQRGRDGRERDSEWDRGTTRDGRDRG